MKPLVTSHIDEIDRARMTFIGQLINHIDKLREEMRINEVILHSVVKSLSSQTDEMMQLDLDLHQHATTTAHHKPLILTEEEQKRLAHMQDRLQRELQDLNNQTN
jgi:D-ribose pyranose/furanose isomerase RbsD